MLTVAGGGPLSTAGTTLSPFGIAIDSSGNLYLADPKHNRVLEVEAGSGTVITVAGNGTAGYSGNGGLATSAELDAPSGVAVDSNGDLFIADTGNNVVREVANVNGPSPEITTVAGNHTNGYSGSGAAATSTELSWPTGLAVDASGNLYIADTGDALIYEVNASTHIATIVAGDTPTTGYFGYSGDGGAATSAELWWPMGVAVDSAGDIYIADTFNDVIREVNTSGIINTIAGNAGLLTGTYGGDNGPATSADLSFPVDVSLDGSGHLFIADYGNDRIREVNLSSGAIATVAGGGLVDNGPGASTALDGPAAMVADTSGRLDIADYANNCVRQLNLTTGLMTTIAGIGISGDNGDSGQATAAALDWPTAVAVNAAGGLFIADEYGQRVRDVNLATGVITTIAGDGTAGYTGNNGPATSAELDDPTGIAVDAAGNLYIADAANNCIREVNLASGTITTIAGDGTAGYSGDNGPATSAELDDPTGVAVDNAGHLFIADEGNDRIREVNLSSGLITTVAGDGTAGYNGDGIQGTAAELDAPADVAVNSAGNLLIADTDNNRIRLLNLSSGVITTVAGNGTAGYSGDSGQATAASINSPLGVAADASGDIFISDTANNVIREVNSAGVIVTLAGTATAGDRPNEVPAAAGTFNGPGGLAVDSAGNLYVADTQNDLVRKLGAATTESVAPAALTITATNETKNYGQTLSFAPTAFTTSGLLNGDAVTSVTFTSAGASASAAAGAYPILCSAAVGSGLSNYTITYVSGTLTVAPVQLTVTVNNQSKVYGGALPGLTASYSGFVNGDSPASLTTQPMLSTTATASSHVAGSPYPITASGAVDPNYTFNYVPGALTVTAAPLTITANNKSMTYGGALPALTAGYAGLVNGDTSAAISGLTLSTAAASSPAGSYPITASGAVDPDYSISYVAGTLTIGQAPLTITASNEGMTYGGALPALTAGYMGLVNGNTSAAISGLVLSTAPAGSPAGSYPITASGAVDPNYSISYLPGTLTIGQAPLTITANNQGMTYGGVMPGLTASYTGLVNGDTSAAISGLVLSTAAASSPAGSYPITASGASDPNYSISYLPGTLTIGQAPLTIAATNQGMTYGGGMPGLTASYMGLVNGDTSAAISGLTLSTAAASSPAGSYPITASGASDPNYSISYLPGTLTIGQAPLTIAANNQGMTYGGGMPGLTASYTGLVNGDTSAAISGLVLSTAAASSPAGSYPITASGASDPNYSISYLPGTLTIGQAPLTITATNQSMTYGGALPGLTAGYAGLVNGDTSAAISGLVLSTAATGSPAGSYPITAGGASDPNYSISYLPGTLTIGKAPLTITPNNQTMTYGGALPGLTASYMGLVNGDTSAAIGGLVLSTAAASSPAGSYPITASGASDPNYSISYLPGTLTIGQAPLTIAANNQGMTYGGGMPGLTASYMGLVNGDTSAAISGLTLSTAAASSPAGSYPITASGASDPNYSISYLPGTLTIGQAPLTIAANNQGMTYGGGMPGLTASYMGLVNGDTSATISGLVLSTAAASSPAGSYPITASGASDPNYSISYLPGTLTIGQAPLTITATNQSMTYGGAMPGLTAGYAGLVNGDTSAAISGLVLSTAPLRAASGRMRSWPAVRPIRTTPSATCPAR